jgi:hypothetical protein
VASEELPWQLGIAAGLDGAGDRHLELSRQLPGGGKVVRVGVPVDQQHGPPFIHSLDRDSTYTRAQAAFKIRAAFLKFSPRRTVV